MAAVGSGHVSRIEYGPPSAPPFPLKRFLISNVRRVETGKGAPDALLIFQSGRVSLRQILPGRLRSSHLRDGRNFSLRSELGRRSEVQWKRSRRGRMYGWGGREGCRMREPRVPSKCLSFPVRLSTLFAPPPALPSSAGRRGHQIPESSVMAFLAS